MSDGKRDILDVLRYELAFLEQNGYGRSLSMPWKRTSIFCRSPSCINFNDPQRTRPCTECPLIDFVPAAARSQDFPCHQIPIGPAGETVGNMEREHDVVKLERTLGDWLRATIQQIERQRAAAPPGPVRLEGKSPFAANKIGLAERSPKAARCAVYCG